MYSARAGIVSRTVAPFPLLGLLMAWVAAIRQFYPTTAV
jgi:hypothetical protein